MVHDLEDKVAKLEQEIISKQQSDDKLLEYADAINAQNKRIEALSNKLQTYITRECILTEVSRYVRNMGKPDLIVSFHLALMRAYNLSDTFWEQRNSSMFSTEEWYE
jgi:septal ring factor EnvC (AmiA/AmiB activator)